MNGIVLTSKCLLDPLAESCIILAIKLGILTEDNYHIKDYCVGLVFLAFLVFHLTISVMNFKIYRILCWLLLHELSFCGDLALSLHV